MLTPAMSSSSRGSVLPEAAVSGTASVSSGSAPAFARDAAALRPIVRAVVAAVLGQHRDHPDVEDCTHEALRRAFEGSSRLRPGEPLRPWVLGIARHVAIDARRKRRREQPALEREGDEESLFDRLMDPGPRPDDRAATREEMTRLGAALEGLAPAQRQAMWLFHVEGLDYQEIAGKLEVPMGTIATWLSRGRKTLAEAIEAAPVAGQAWRARKA